MQLSQVQAFVEVARTASVSRAADAMFVSQPALTSRLQQLEKELAAKLFHRTSHGMRLTEAGEAFLPFAVRALESLSDGRQIVNAFERGGAGRLALGAAPALSTYALPTMLKEFATAYPRVRVSVRTGHSEEVLDLVLREQVDLGLTRVLRHPDIVSTPLYEDSLVLVCDPSHRFAERGEIHLEEIAREQLVQFDRTSSYTELTNALFRTAGVRPDAVMELDAIDAAKKMVELGFGVALLPQTAVADEIAAGRLRLIEITDAQMPRPQLVAIRRRDRGDASGTVAAFLATATVVGPELTK